MMNCTGVPRESRRIAGSRHWRRQTDDFIRRGGEHQHQQTAVQRDDAEEATNSKGWVSMSSAASRMVASVPPRDEGNAREHRDVFALLGLFLLESSIGCGRAANTMSSAIRNNRLPPAMRKELKAIPMTARNRAPTSENSTQMATRSVSICRPFFSCRARSRPASGREQRDQRNGSTTTKKTTKN